MHVFITGAATGIGEVTIDAWLKKEPNTKFTIADKNKASLDTLCAKLKSRGVEAFGITADLTDIEKLPGVVKKSREKFGDIDLLINNAGIMPVGDFSRMSWDTGMLIMNLNLMAPIRLMYEVIPGMVARKSGGVINIASMAGKTILPGCSWYGASKAGIGHLSEIAGTEVQDAGVHILTVYPGPIQTELATGARSGLEENLATKYMPVGQREILAEKIVTAYLRKQHVLAYPEIYDMARHFHTVAAWFSRMLAPRSKAA